MTLVELDKDYTLVESVTLLMQGTVSSVALLRSRRKPAKLYTAVCFENGHYTVPVLAAPESLRALKKLRNKA